MTEVPAHLLERTRQRRLALGLPVSGGGDAPASGGTATATATAVEDAAPAVIDPAVASAIAEAPGADVAVVEESPAVQAAHRRPKAPWWAIVALVTLPLWALFYFNSLERPVSEPALIAAGRALYSEAGCSGCHGADGHGAGAGPSLADVHESFPDPGHMGLWIRLGSAGWAAEYGAETPYGAQPRFIGDTLGSGAQMPGHGLDKLNDEELLEVVMFIRHGINEDVPLTADDAEEPSDAVGAYEAVHIDEDGRPIVDESFTSLIDAGGDPLWEEFIAEDGGDLVLE